MTIQLPEIVDGRFALTQTELDYLDAMLEAGDRAGFYLTYGSMIAYEEDNGRAELSVITHPPLR
jgi:hypothetical protein